MDNALKKIGYCYQKGNAEREKYGVPRIDKQVGYRRHHSDSYLNELTPVPVAKYQPNKWGFYDMIGNSPELMADILPCEKDPNFGTNFFNTPHDGGWTPNIPGGIWGQIMAYQTALDKQLKDPCFICRKNAYYLFRGTPSCSAYKSYPDGTLFPNGHIARIAPAIFLRRDVNGPICAFRLCIGPKLKPTYVD